jgi:ABC-type antimicrobial peptide transport system permease subunit
MGIIAGIALLMALVGIHGVVAYSVAQRTREIGVRMALGATRPNVLLMIINQILGVAVTGVLIGICGALALTRFMQSLLYDVGPRDPDHNCLGGLGLNIWSRSLLVSARRFAPLVLTPSLLCGTNRLIGLAE